MHDSPGKVLVESSREAETSKAHDRVPRQVDGIQLNVGQVMEHVGGQRQRGGLVAGDLRHQAGRRQIKTGNMLSC